MLNFDESSFGNSDLTAATGLASTTIQTWVNRGVLPLSAQQRNPGAGQKRIYSALEIARIAAMKALIDRGMAASSAGQLALRLERSPQTASGWRTALEDGASHIHVFVDGVDVATIYSGNDPRELGRIQSAFNEPTPEERRRLDALHLDQIRLGNGQRDRILSGLSRVPEWDTQIAANSAEIAALTKKVTIFDIGPEVHPVLEKLRQLERERTARAYTLWFIPKTAKGRVLATMEGRPVGSGPLWRRAFATLDDLQTGFTQAWPLPPQQMAAILRSLAAGETVQLSWSGDHPLTVAEQTLVSLGLTEQP